MRLGDFKLHGTWGTHLESTGKVPFQSTVQLGPRRLRGSSWLVSVTARVTLLPAAETFEKGKKNHQCRTG